MSFCVACGEPLQRAPAQPVPAPYAPYDARAHAAPAPAGPKGRVQEAWLPVVLSLVTLGIYGAFYWWRVTREVDDRLQKPGHAHRMAKLGILLGLASGVVYVAAFGAFFVAMFSAVESETGELPPDAMVGVLWTLPLFVLGWLGMLTGYILLVVGKWRVWSFLQNEDQRRLRPQPFNAALMLVLTLVPFVNLVGHWTALYMTQDRLNEVWQST